MTMRQKWINPLKDRNVRANLEATRILAERGLLPELPATVDEEKPLTEGNGSGTELHRNGGELR